MSSTPSEKRKGLVLKEAMAKHLALRGGGGTRDGRSRKERETEADGWNSEGARRRERNGKMRQ